MKNFNLYTSIKYQRKKRLNLVIFLTLEWCIEKWGLKPHEHQLELIMDYDYDFDVKAEYTKDLNEIIVYVRNHKNIRDLIDSVIHEFTHQRQNMDDYGKIFKMVGYRYHPLEIEANETAKKYRKCCWLEIKDKINKL